MFKKRKVGILATHRRHHRAVAAPAVELPFRSEERQQPYRLRRVHAQADEEQWVELTNPSLSYAGADHKNLYFQYPADFPGGELLAMSHREARDLPLPEEVSDVLEDLRGRRIDARVGDPGQLGWNFLGTQRFAVGALSGYNFCDSGQYSHSLDQDGHAQIAGKCRVGSEPAVVIAYWPAKWPSDRGPAFGWVEPVDLSSLVNCGYTRQTLLPFIDAYVADESAPDLLLPNAVPQAAAAPEVAPVDLEQELYSVSDLGEAHALRDLTQTARLECLQSGQAGLELAQARLDDFLRRAANQPGFLDGLSGPPQSALPNGVQPQEPADQHLQALHAIALRAARQFEWLRSAEGLARVAGIYQQLAQGVSGHSPAREQAQRAFHATALLLRQKASDVATHEPWAALMKASGVGPEDLRSAWEDLREVRVQPPDAWSVHELQVARSREGGPKRGDTVRLAGCDLKPLGKAAGEQGSVLLCEIEAVRDHHWAVVRDSELVGLRVALPEATLARWVGKFSRDEDLLKYLRDPNAPDWLAGDETEA